MPYKKVIVVDEESKAFVTIRKYKKLNVFEVPLNKKVYFHLDVISASNMEATRENVYWIAQSHDDFGTRQYLEFKGVPKNQKEFHKFLNSLNKGTIHAEKYLKTPDGKYFLEDIYGNKIRNTKYVNYTVEDTEYIRSKYIATNPYKSNDEKREGVFLGNLGYTATRLGEGVWIEGINYKPEFKEQGAFIIAVEKPQIVSLLIEKRTKAEKKVRAGKVKKGDTDTVAQELMYGDMLDIHMHLHNVLNGDYTITYEVFYKGKSLSNDYSYILPLKLPSRDDNPSLEYNSAFIEEILIDYRWAGDTHHKEGIDNEDSIQEYTFKILCRPTSAEAIKKRYPTLERDITFKVNYKSDFSYELHEKKYKANIAKIYQPPLVTQLYEKDCYYRKLEVSSNGYETKTYLLETDQGALLSYDRGTTPKFSVVAGNKKNLKTIIIETDANVANCTELLEEDKHTGKTFDLQGVQEYSYENGDATWDILSNIELLPKVQPYQKELKRTDQVLEFEVAYPYDAPNEHYFLWRYLFLYINQYKNPAAFYIRVQSCRYTRTIWFNVHPDVEWAAHFFYNANMDNAVYFRGFDVTLVEGSATYMSWIADLANYLYKKAAPIFEYFADTAGKKAMAGIQKKIEDFIKENVKRAHIGFHARYDIKEPTDKESGTLINYSEIQPYRAVLQYQIFAIASLTLVVDLLLLYLTKGGGKATKAGKLVKKAGKVKDKFDKTLDDNNLSFGDDAKISSNMAFYKEMQDNGMYASIFELTLQARPLIALKFEKEFKNSLLTDKLLKYDLKLSANGAIWYDLNIKYNTHTRKYTLTDSADKQNAAISYSHFNKETGKYEPFKGTRESELKNGDFVKIESFIHLKVAASVQYEQEFNALWKLGPVKVSTDVDVKLHTSISYIKKFGVDAQGPYIEKFIDFGGLRGDYMIKGGVSSKIYSTYYNAENERKKVDIFKEKTIDLGKNYLFRGLKPKENHQK